MRWNEITNTGESTEIQDHLDSIDEAFDGGVAVQWNHKSSSMWNGSFTIQQQRYLLDIVEEQNYDAGEGDEGTVWDLEFTATGSHTKYRNTGDMGQDGLKVFSTVLQGMMECIQEVQPAKVKFTGDKDQKRGDLYGKIMKSIAGRLAAMGYQWRSHDKPNTVIFIIEKK